jgi:hypothetical protein
VKYEGFFAFLRKRLELFQIVFLVLGNHEVYHSDWAETKSKVQQFSETIVESSQRGEAIGKFVVLDQTR